MVAPAVQPVEAAAIDTRDEFDRAISAIKDLNTVSKTEWDLITAADFRALLDLRDHVGVRASATSAVIVPPAEAATGTGYGPDATWYLEQNRDGAWLVIDQASGDVYTGAPSDEMLDALSAVTALACADCERIFSTTFTVPLAFARPPAETQDYLDMARCLAHGITVREGISHDEAGMRLWWHAFQTYSIELVESPAPALSFSDDKDVGRLYSLGVGTVSIAAGGLCPSEDMVAILQWGTAGLTELRLVPKT